MAVTVTGSATSSDGNVTTGLTYSNTIASDADCLVVGAVILTDTTPVGTVSGITCGGVAMTQVVTNVDTLGPWLRSYLYRLLAPPTGSQSVVVSTSGNVNHMASGAQGFKGVDQTTPVSNSNSNRGNSASASVSVTSATGEYTMDTVGAGSALSAPTQTQLWNTFSTTNSGGSRAAGAASVSFGWTVVSDIWVDVALSLKAGAAGPIPVDADITNFPKFVLAGTSPV